MASGLLEMGKGFFSPWLPRTMGTGIQTLGGLGTQVWGGDILTLLF